MPQLSIENWLSSKPESAGNRCRQTTTTSSYERAASLSDDERTKIGIQADCDGSHLARLAPRNDPSEDHRDRANRDIIDVVKPPADNQLPAQVILTPVSSSSIKSLRRLNGLLLPIRYPDRFYKEAVADNLEWAGSKSELNLVALWKPAGLPDGSGTASPAASPLLIGGIRCRLLSIPLAPSAFTSESGDVQCYWSLYIASLVILSLYRGHGIASALLAICTQRATDRVRPQSSVASRIEAGTEDGDSPKGPYIVAGQLRSIEAHVWEANADARHWYASRGFKEISVLEGYYRKLNPTSAILVRKDLQAQLM